MSKKKEWKPEIEYRPVNKLVPYARNAKTHPDRQIDQLAGAIAEYGFLVPVVVDKEGILIAGHGRVLAAQKLGIDKVPCILASHLTENQIKAWRLADNRLAESPWDTDMLRFELGSLKDLGVDLKMTGFDLPELDLFVSDGKIVDGLFDAPRNIKSIDLSSLISPDQSDQIRQINELTPEEARSEIADFKPGEKYINLIFQFKTEEDRENYCLENNIESEKKSGQWIVYK